MTAKEYRHVYVIPCEFEETYFRTYETSPLRTDCVGAPVEVTTLEIKSVCIRVQLFFPYRTRINTDDTRIDTDLM